MFGFRLPVLTWIVQLYAQNLVESFQQVQMTGSELFYHIFEFTYMTSITDC